MLCLFFTLTLKSKRNQSGWFSKPAFSPPLLPCGEWVLPQPGKQALPFLHLVISLCFPRPSSNCKKKSKSKKVLRRNLKNTLKEIVVYEQPRGRAILLHGPYDLAIPGSTSSTAQPISGRTHPVCGLCSQPQPSSQPSLPPSAQGDTPPAQMTVRRPRLASQKTTSPAGWPPFSQKLKQSPNLSYSSFHRTYSLSVASDEKHSANSEGHWERARERSSAELQAPKSACRNQQKRQRVSLSPPTPAMPGDRHQPVWEAVSAAAEPSRSRQWSGSCQSLPRDSGEGRNSNPSLSWGSSSTAKQRQQQQFRSLKPWAKMTPAAVAPHPYPRQRTHIKITTRIHERSHSNILRTLT